MILKKSKTITLSNWILGQIVHYLNFPKIGVPSKIYTNIYNKKNINIDLIYKIYDYIGITHLIPRLLVVFGFGNSFIFILTK